MGNCQYAVRQFKINQASRYKLVQCVKKISHTRKREPPRQPPHASQVNRRLIFFFLTIQISVKSVDEKRVKYFNNKKKTFLLFSLSDLLKMTDVGESDVGESVTVS